jgi:hypothetical protein
MSLKKMTSLFCCAAMLLGVVACASTLSKANKLYEAGQYEDAAAMYENILFGDPGNVDAKIGLSKARSELWKKELVSVRMLRMSGDAVGALTRLESLLGKIQQWDMSSFSSGSLSSAEEEVRFARVALEAQVRQKIAERKGVVAHVLWEKHKNVRRAKFQGGFSGTVGEEIKTAGASQCASVREWVSDESFSFGSVLRALCSRFGVEISLPALNSQHDYRFSKVAATGAFDVQGLELKQDEVGRLLLTALDTELSRRGLLANLSPRALPLAMRGNVVRDYQKNNVAKTHSYFVEVPYQASEKYEDEEIVEVVENGVKRSVARKVPKTRVVTRMRKEPRTYSYAAVEHREKFAISVALDVRDLVSDYGFSAEQRNEFTSHNTDMPNIGLKASPPKFFASTNWVKEQFAKTAQEFVQKMALGLSNAQCQLAKASSAPAGVAEHYSRCAELDPHNAEASAWFVGTFGYNRVELMKHLAGERGEAF